MAIMSGRLRSLFQGIRPTARIKRAGLETGLTEQVAGTFRGIIAVPIAGKRCLRQTNQHSKTRARSVGRVATRSLTSRAGPLPAFAITHVTLHT